jgi:Pvc16 N-terminal domain
MNQTTIDSGHILRAVSESLRRLIRHYVPELQSESAIVFDSPGEIESHDETKLSLYLYQTEINPYLRNLPPSLTRRTAAQPLPAALAVTPSPLVVDLTYLLVPYGKSAELELVLVNKLIQLFHDVGQLSGEWLNPVLRQSGNNPIEIVPEHDSSEQLRNIWSVFPNKTYKLTKMYTLSPVRIPSSLTLQSDMVIQADTTYVGRR